MAYPPAGYTSRRDRKWAQVSGKKPALRPDKRARGGGVIDDAVPKKTESKDSKDGGK